MGDGAKARGAHVVHVDPRFTRTSALADRHVPLRAGSDIAFLGGVINYILSNKLDFRDYVTAYTNASVIVDERFCDTEDLDGLFSGYDHDTASYDRSTWQYESTGGTQHGVPDQHGSGGPPVEGAAHIPADPTLQHPRCVYQILKRHFARYTPEMVERVCGVPAEQFLYVARKWAENSGRERTAALVYSVGLDAALDGGAVHPRRVDHPAAARQHRPPRRRGVRTKPESVDQPGGLIGV